MYPLAIAITDSTVSFQVGQAYGGGIIVYVDGTGKSGIICADQDISTTAQWGCGGSWVSSTSTNLGTGQSNTTNIVNVCATAGIAARLCNDSTLNGYSDWYLPSRDELALAFTVGVINEGGWWSSSQVDAGNVWQIYNGGIQRSWGKGNTSWVRPFRSF